MQMLCVRRAATGTPHIGTRLAERSEPATGCRRHDSSKVFCHWSGFFLFAIAFVLRTTTTPHGGRGSELVGITVTNVAKCCVSHFAERPIAISFLSPCHLKSPSESGDFSRHDRVRCTAHRISSCRVPGWDETPPMNPRLGCEEKSTKPSDIGQIRFDHEHVLRRNPRHLRIDAGSDGNWVASAHLCNFAIEKETHFDREVEGPN